MYRHDIITSQVREAAERHAAQEALPSSSGRMEVIGELLDIGYNEDEIILHLTQESNDAPWIYSPQPEIHLCMPDKNHHIERCVHRLAAHGWKYNAGVEEISHSRNLQHSGSALQGIDRQSLSPENHAVDRERTLLEVEQLCGIAGVTPPEPRHEDAWIGVVIFDDDHTHSTICYRRPGATDYMRNLAVFRNNLEVLKNLFTAMATLQKAGLCCNTFTVLVRLNDLHDEPQDHLFLKTLDLSPWADIQPDLQRWEQAYYDELEGPPVMVIGELIASVLSVFGPSRMPSLRSLDDTLHWLSLSLQFLTVGLLSYAHAHVGPIEPYFIDTPQERITLSGLGELDTCIKAHLFHLTCLDDMLQSPVLAFGMDLGDAHFINPDLRYKLVGRAEDIIDTFGPGGVLCKREASEPVALKLVDGFAVLTDESSNELHWPSDLTEDLSRLDGFDIERSLIIGSPVTVNQHCSLKEDDCRRDVSANFHTLGTHKPHWLYNERQMGFQTGQYFMLQANFVSSKVPGRGEKQRILNPQSDRTFVQNLEAPWGLQVSLCIGVARRVTLRQLVTDLMPKYADREPCRPDLWQTLITTHGFYDYMQGEAKRFRTWLNGLHEDYQREILTLARQMLTDLKYTGVDREGVHFNIAWPSLETTSTYIPVSCADQGGWARLLADSDSCATFAYATPLCLESTSTKCGSQMSVSQSAIRTLATEVSPLSVGPFVPGSQTTTVLKHQQHYYIENFDYIVQLTASRSPTTDITNLIAKSSAFNRDRKLWKRFNPRRRNAIRIREKQLGTQFVEAVLVSALPPPQQQLAAGSLP